MVLGWLEGKQLRLRRGDLERARQGETPRAEGQDQDFESCRVFKLRLRRGVEQCVRRTPWQELSDAEGRVTRELTDPIWFALIF